MCNIQYQAIAILACISFYTVFLKKGEMRSCLLSLPSEKSNILETLVKQQKVISIYKIEVMEGLCIYVQEISISDVEKGVYCGDDTL